MTRAYINRVAVAVPEHEVHGTFVRFAERLFRDRRSRILFERMAERSEIEQRWSCLARRPGGNESLDGEGFYTLGNFHRPRSACTATNRAPPGLKRSSGLASATRRRSPI